MLIKRIRRKLSSEFAARFARQPSRLPVTGRRISVCFDDFPQTAAAHGAAVLQEAGARGTYYFAAGLANTLSPAGLIVSIEDVRSLADRGHEIGCHSFGHQDCSQLSQRELKSSLDENQQALDFCKFESFAYPFGYADWQSKAVVAKRFQTVRTTTRGLNVGHVDLAGLLAVPLYEHLGVTWADRWLEQLTESDGWLILYAHDVAPEPSRFGCKPQLLAHCLRRAAQMGCQVDTVGATARLLE